MAFWKTTICLITLLLAMSAALSSTAAPLGSVVVAKAGGDAVIIWQASPEIAMIVRTGTPDADAITQVAADALRIIVERRASIDGRANSVTVNVIYAHDAGVSPVYKAETFGGFENLMTVKASRQALAHIASWESDISAKRMPAGVRVTTTGTLPH